MIGTVSTEERKNKVFSPYNEFCDAAEVWFWCCRCRMGKSTKFFKTDNQQARICETNDIYLIVKKLQTSGLLKHRHIKTMVKYGIKQMPPSKKHGDTLWECHIWQQAMLELEKELKKRDIII